MVFEKATRNLQITLVTVHHRDDTHYFYHWTSLI